MLNRVADIFSNEACTFASEGLRKRRRPPRSTTGAVPAVFDGALILLKLTATVWKPSYEKESPCPEGQRVVTRRKGSDFSIARPPAIPSRNEKTSVQCRFPDWSNAS